MPTSSPRSVLSLSPVCCAQDLIGLLGLTQGLRIFVEGAQDNWRQRTISLTPQELGARRAAAWNLYQEKKQRERAQAQVASPPVRSRSRSPAPSPQQPAQQRQAERSPAACATTSGRAPSPEGDSVASPLASPSGASDSYSYASSIQGMSPERQAHWREMSSGALSHSQGELRGTCLREFAALRRVSNSEFLK